MLITASTPLLFMHVPKTGGMSLFSAFTKIWGEEIADLYNISAANEDEAAKLLADEKKQLYCGHFAFGLHRWMQRPCFYISVLREPVSRMVSLFHFCQPMLDAYEKRLSIAGGSMAELARQPSVSDFYLDFEPCLRGDRSAEAFFSSPSAELDNAIVRRFSGYGLLPEKCPASALDVAKVNIECHFSFVGLLERYDETLRALATLFGLPEIRKEHVNRNPVQQTKQPLSDSVLNKIREMNALDIQLYDWVRERFDQMAAELREPVLVPGENCARPITPLWRAVGQSPIREASMKAQVFVRPNKSDPPLVFCSQAKRLVLNETAVMADVDLCFFQSGFPGDDATLNRLVMQPAAAKRLSEQLAKAVEKYEAAYGTIKSLSR